MKKIFSLLAAVLFAGSMMAETETIFTYNGKGVTKAEDVVKAGGTLTVYGGNTNIVADQKQKGNMCIKINKGFTKDGIYYYMGITLDKPLQAGDKITTAAFRTGTSACVYGMDFNAEADSASATDAVQVLFADNLQVLSSDGVPADTTFEIPAAAAGAKFIRLYRKSGSTGLWIANFTITREGGVTPPAVETPVISGDIEFTDSVVVTITCSTPNADIYYTTDGTTDPKCDCAAAPEYKKAIVLKETTTIMAAAYTGNDWSAVATKTFTKVVPPTPAEHTYTVAGGSDVLFGTTWAPANTANDMVKQEDGTYKWEKTELTLPAGTIEFKVCEDHAWTTAYPAQNYELNIAEAGIYTITITFEPANENTVSAVATKTGEAVVIPTVAMHGNFLGSWADTENFTLADNKETATLALTIAEGNYEFGMRIGGSGNWMSNGSAFTRENNSFVIAAGSGNLTLAADLAGEYIFTWTFETNTLTITYPAVAPVVTTYEVAEAIAAGLTDDTEIQVRGIITKMEFKGKNFAKYGSVNIYVADATGAEGEFEFYNCYSLNADTFKTSTPAYDAESTAWAEFEEVVDANGVAIHVGDTVIAFGKYTLYNNTVYELKQGCYLVDIKEGEGGQEETIGYDYEPTTVSTFDVTIASVSVKDYVADYGVITFELEDADGAYFAYLELISSTSEPATGTYPINFTEQDGTFYASPGGDDQYDYGCYFGVMDGEYYNPYYMVSGSVEIAEDGMTVNATSYNGSTIKLTYKAPEEAIDNTEVKASAVKFLQNDQLIIEKNGVRYNANGQQIR